MSEKYIDTLRGDRILLTEIWYPEEVSGFSKTTGIQKYPLVLLSHGTGGNRFSLIWLAKMLASEGFIVASVDHFGNTTDNKIPEYFVRYWERPLDISFVIDMFLKEPAFSSIIDHDKLAVVGFSLGGYTSLALAGARLDCSLLKIASKSKLGKRELTVPEMGDLRGLIDKIDCQQVPGHLKDKRIKAFVALSPAMGLGFSSREQFTVNSPVLIIGAEADTIAPIKSNTLKYQRFIPSSEIHILKGNIGHYIFLPKIKKYEAAEAVFFEDPSGVDRTMVHHEVGAMIKDFLNRSL